MAWEGFLGHVCLKNNNDEEVNGVSVPWEALMIDELLSGAGLCVRS